MTTKIASLCRNNTEYSLGDTRHATPTERLLGLQLKLHEEVGEVCNHMRDVEEYADVLQVLYDLAIINGISREDIEKARHAKSIAKGNFIEPSILWTAKCPS